MVVKGGTSATTRSGGEVNPTSTKNHKEIPLRRITEVKGNSYK